VAPDDVANPGPCTLGETVFVCAGAALPQLSGTTCGPPFIPLEGNVATYCCLGPDASNDAARGDDDGPTRRWSELATRPGGRCSAAVPGLGFSVPGAGTVYPSRTGSNELFGSLRAAFFPEIGDPAKLTR
jgi:hypothetical protein